MQALYAVPADRLVVAPNGYDETRIVPPTAEQRARARRALGLDDGICAAVLIGSDFTPNREALERLTTQVMPAVAGAGFRLVVAGGITRALAGPTPSWMVARPETPDLAAILHGCDIGLNPITTGSGSNVKLPTYLGAGLAVITTPHGVRGFEALAPWLTVAAPDAFADALRARPAGWSARGLAAPAPLAAFALGAIGERLGEALEARLRASLAPALRAGGQA